jgi:RNA polymerase sigma-70 factor (ECF subfamily)
MTSPVRARPTVLPPDDAALVARIRLGDYAAFLALFRQYYAPLHRFGTRLTGSPDVADDLVQDVFVAVWERRTTWTVTSRVERYLYAAVRNRAFDDARRRAVEARIDPEFANGAECAATDSVEVMELRATVAHAIERLPHRCRAVYRLRHYYQLTNTEIAHVLGLSVKTVEMHVTAALRTLRGRLQHLR